MPLIQYSLPSVLIRNDIPPNLLTASEFIASQWNDPFLSFKKIPVLKKELKKMLLSSGGTKLKYEFPDDEKHEYMHMRQWIREYFRNNESRKSMDHKPTRIPMELRQWRKAEEVVKEIDEVENCTEEEHELRIFLLDEILETLEGYQKYSIPAGASPLLRRLMED